ncbi:hypothetical protein [Kineosporia babensis]|uniref:Uncharacterized protein n=1 Tax=Kineosporia babensis TaxID=499548 RepID=A0A9X1NCA2_9ACTN|nr:hypothetical protein [Kineosporia babensis]MCD5311119.1 hypothetical protein [Kineosporia babensis]
MTSSPWDWPDLSFNSAGFCLSLSRGQDVQRVLAAYAVAPEHVQPRSYAETIALFHPGVNLLLRVGTLADVGFCFEQGSVLGILAPVQNAMGGAGGESLTICNTPEQSRVNVIHTKDGRTPVMFDLGMKLEPAQSTAVLQQMDERWRADGRSKAQAALEVASSWVGAPFGWQDSFAGVLDTAILPATHQPPARPEPPRSQPSRSGLGRSGGPLIPPPA